MALPKGLPTGIEDNTPVRGDEARRSRERLEEEKLRDKAGFAGVLQSEAGERLIAVVKDQLLARIINALRDDPGAVELIRLLATLGSKDNHAKEAVERIERRYIQRD